MPNKVVWVLLGACILTSCDRIDHWFDHHRQAIDQSLLRAKQLYEQRDYLGAIATYEEVLRIQPNNNADIYFKIALIYDRNLNDYLNAAYYYKRFLQSSPSESANVDLARSALENVKLQFAATIPNVGNQGTEELAKLRSENIALHRQVEELKKEMIRPQNKPMGSVSEGNKQPRVSPSLPATAKLPLQQPLSYSKTYVVKKGDGIQAIAEKFYGNRGRWKDIMAANPEIKDSNQLKPGQVLILP